METVETTILEHVIYGSSLLAGVTTHIVKKVMQHRLEKNDKTFHLKTFLMAYPYQSFLVLMAGVGSYLTLMGQGELGAASAFLAGIASNSFGDLAPGDRYTNGE